MPEGSSAKPPPTVFISYAHESDALRTSVRALADWLGARGCNVLTDHRYTHRPPDVGWTGWMNDCIDQADVVLVVCTPKLKERYSKSAPPQTGRGATFEGAIVTQYIYNSAMRNTKLFPIMPEGGTYDDVPITLQNWWNGHYFPSGYEGIRRLIFDEIISTGMQIPPARLEIAGSDWSIEERHERLTARLLELAPPFVAVLRSELADEFDLRPASQTPVDVIGWLSQASTNVEAVRQFFYVVRRALLALSEASGGDRDTRKNAEEAAAALYCLAACRLVDRTAHDTGQYVLRVPRTEAVIYAVIATALFGGELRLQPAAPQEMPTPEYVFEVHVPAGGHQVETDFERAAYVALFPNRREATREVSLDAGPLDSGRRADLIARLASLKNVRRVSFALVVHGVAEGKPLQAFAGGHRVPVMIPGDAAGNALLLVEAETLRAEIGEFWSDLRTLRPSDPQQTVQQPLPHFQGASGMSPSGISIVTRDGATIAVATGNASPARATSRQGIEAAALGQVLRDLARAIEESPAEAREALAPHVAALKDEAGKDKPDDGRIRQALDAIDGTVKKSAGILESGEKIAGLLYRAYQHLSSLL